jgi:osmotically inducible lipoprotein OsmB
MCLLVALGVIESFGAACFNHHSLCERSSMRKLLAVCALGMAVLVSGCATPLGQQYGTAGAIGGGVIGGAAGGFKGAAIGAAAGALLGGAVGDSVPQGPGYREPAPYYGEPGYRQYRPAPYYRCHPVDVAVYDHRGHFRGYERVCR